MVSLHSFSPRILFAILRKKGEIQVVIQGGRVKRSKTKTTVKGESVVPATERVEPRMVRSTLSLSHSQLTKMTYKMDDIVRLNVGGQRFDTRLRTLLSDRSNDLFGHFVVLLEPEISEAKLPPRDLEGNFFLDRDPEHFRSLLNNLRFHVQLQAKQKLANGTNGILEDDEEVRASKSVGFLGRLLKN